MNRKAAVIIATMYTDSIKKILFFFLICLEQSEPKAVASIIYDARRIVQPIYILRCKHVL